MREASILCFTGLIRAGGAFRPLSPSAVAPSRKCQRQRWLRQMGYIEQVPPGVRHVMPLCSCHGSRKRPFSRLKITLPANFTGPDQHHPIEYEILGVAPAHTLIFVWPNRWHEARVTARPRCHSSLSMPLLGLRSFLQPSCQSVARVLGTPICRTNMTAS